VNLTFKQEVKFLGCILKKMTGDSTAVALLKIRSNRITFLARQAAYLDKQSLIILADALVQAHFDYMQ